MVDNRIERETEIAAPADLVWRAVTEPEHVGAWFGSGQPTRIDLRPGGRIVFDHPGHGDIPAVVETVDAPRSYSFRWAVIGPPGEEPREGNSTVVELFGFGARSSVTRASAWPTHCLAPIVASDESLGPWPGFEV